MKTNPLILKDPEKEIDRIVVFLERTFQKQKISKAVIGVSGGIDSATSLSLVVKAIGPENVTAIHMPYFQKKDPSIEELIEQLKIPKQNFQIISIKKPVDVIAKNLEIYTSSQIGKVRFGNIAARVRMITLFDYAKKEQALVVGTENKSEHILSYFTRFGDEASDVEPIQHLYKTQIYQIVEKLKVPRSILTAKPTAGLWNGQTDEKEFGFSYEEADQVMYLKFEKKQSQSAIEKKFKNAPKILEWIQRNEYKHEVPYKFKLSI